MKRLAKRSSGGRAFQPESLEPRALRTSGVLSASNLILDLGVVSLPAAAHGVEVAASIEAGGSVTFQFQAEAAGYYALRVRHTGEGLTLEARGPSGASSIDPGPPGSFETLILSIREASYQIQASATADQPVFVDWELLLISGIGQAPAVSSTLIAPLESVPMPGLSASAGVVTWNPTATPPPAPTPSPLPGPVCTSSTPGLSGPVGRPSVYEPIAPVGPSTPGGSLSMAFHGDGIPAGIDPGDTPPSSIDGTPTSNVSTTMSRDAFALAESDEATLEDESRWVRLALAMAPSLSQGEPTGADLGEPLDLELPASEDQPTEMAGLDPGMMTGVAVTIAIARRRPFKAVRDQPFGSGRPWSSEASD